jgi:PAS domain S-box-containing protein
MEDANPGKEIGGTAGSGRELPNVQFGIQAVPVEQNAGEQPHADPLERVTDCFIALDRDWHYTYVNRQAAALFGRRPEDLIGKHIWTEFPEGVGRPFHRAYERALSEQVFVQMDCYHEPWNRWFENHIYPSPDGLSILFHEITERKRAEQSAAHSAELLKIQNDVLELIVRGASLHQTLDFLLRATEAQSQGMLCSILLLDRDGVHVRHGAAPSLPESFIRAVDGKPIGPRAGSCGTAAFRRAPVIVNDIEHDSLWEDYRDLALQHGLRACWSTPIFDAQNCVLGTFALYFRSPTHPTPWHFELIEQATHSAAIAIVKHRETEALRASEERLRLAVTGGNVGIWEWRVGTNQLQWSRELYRMFGWPERHNGLTLRTFMKAVHPDDRRSTAGSLQRSLARRSDFSVEYRILQPDGSLRWVEAKGRAEFDRSGRPARMMGVALDITERKTAEEEINRRQAQLAEAQRIAQLGTYEWNIRNNQVYRSEELCKIYGVPASQFEPTFEGYLGRVHPEDRETTRATIERALHERRPFDFEERIVRSDGAVRVLHSQGKWILDQDGAPAKLVGICQDITERKEAELELRRSEERFHGGPRKSGIRPPQRYVCA